MTRFAFALALFLLASGAFGWGGNQGGSGGGGAAGATGTTNLVKGISSNLVLEWASANTVTLTADRIVLDDGSGATHTYSSVSATGGLAGSVGANGPDAGSGVDVVSSFVYVWAIGKSDDTFALLLSHSGTTPTMPIGYTFKHLVSAPFNNSAGDLDRFIQVGSSFQWYSANGAHRLLSSVAKQSSYADLDCSAYIPPGVRLAKFWVQSTALSYSGDLGIYLRPPGTGLGATGEVDSGLYVNVGSNPSNNMVVADTVNCVLSASRHIEWRNITSASSCSNRIDVVEYLFPQ